MAEIAKLFRNGRSQAVRLPMEFRFQGEAVRIRRLGNGVLLEPIENDVDEWFRQMDAFGDEPFMKEGRNQAAMPVRKIF